MLRCAFLFCSIIMFQLLIAQSGNLTIDLDHNQTINLRSMSNQDSLDILINHDTTLTINVVNNHLFYIEKSNTKYYLYLTDNELHSTLVHINDSIHVSGHNNQFIIFLNEYINLYQSKFDIELLMSNYSNIDELEIYMYNLINNDIYSFYNNHRYFDFFSTSMRDYFRNLLKYEYLNAISHSLFTVQRNQLNIDQDNTQLVLERTDLKWLDWDDLMSSFQDISYYGLSIFQDYTFNALFLFALDDYNTSIKNINDFQNFTLFFLNFLYKHTPIDLRFIYLQKMFRNCSAALQKNTFDYIIQYLIKSDMSAQKIELLTTMFENDYNLVVDKDFNFHSKSIMSHDFYLEDQFGEELNLDSFLGKILYIDIWASWCGPCRKQFPYSKELKHRFSKRQQKKIEFIYISIDNDHNKWKTSLDKLNIEGEHFISPASHPNSAANYFQASSIPRYILIDKNGKILNMHAKRPSDETLFEELLNLLD